MDVNNSDGSVNSSWTSDNQIFTATLLMKVTTALIMYLTPIIIGKYFFSQPVHFLECSFLYIYIYIYVRVCGRPHGCVCWNDGSNSA